MLPSSLKTSHTAMPNQTCELELELDLKLCVTCSKSIYPMLGILKIVANKLWFGVDQKMDTKKIAFRLEYVLNIYMLTILGSIINMTQGDLYDKLIHFDNE
jgi:hypothetical protein